MSTPSWPTGSSSEARHPQRPNHHPPHRHPDRQPDRLLALVRSVQPAPPSCPCRKRPSNPWRNSSAPKSSTCSSKRNSSRPSASRSSTPGNIAASTSMPVSSSPRKPRPTSKTWHNASCAITTHPHSVEYMRTPKSNFLSVFPISLANSARIVLSDVPCRGRGHLPRGSLRTRSWADARCPAPFAAVGYCSRR